MDVFTKPPGTRLHLGCETRLFACPFRVMIEGIVMDRFIDPTMVDAVGLVGTGNPPA